MPTGEAGRYGSPVGVGASTGPEGHGCPVLADWGRTRVAVPGCGRGATFAVGGGTVAGADTTGGWVSDASGETVGGHRLSFLTMIHPAAQVRPWRANRTRWAGMVIRHIRPPIRRV